MKLTMTRASKFGYRRAQFLACDDGSQICIQCIEPVSGRYDQHGPSTNVGECHNCGLRVQMAEWIGGPSQRRTR